MLSKVSEGAPPRNHHASVLTGFNLFLLVVALSFFLPVYASSAQDLCSLANGVTGDHTNTSVPFTLSDRQCVQITVTGCSCGQPDCWCSYVIINSTNQEVARYDYPCTSPPAIRNICLDPGDYTLFADVCSGGSVNVQCNMTTNCCPL